MLSIYAFTIDFLFIVRDHPITVLGVFFSVPMGRVDEMDDMPALSNKDGIKTFGEACRL